MTITKSTIRRQGLKGDLRFEGSRSENLRVDGQKSHIRPNPWAREHNIPKPIRRTWGMVNAAIVQGKIMQLPGEVCQPKLLNRSGGIGSTTAFIKMAEVSRRREPGINTRERSEGSVVRRSL